MRKFISPFLFLSLLAGLLFIFSTPAMADDDPPGRVARLNYIQGSLSFQPGGESDWVQANPNRPLTTGDNLWADRNSRGELHIGSTAIRIASQTGITFLNLDDRTVQIQLAQGSLSAHVRRLDGGDAFEIDTPNLAFTLQRPGEYRVDVDPDGNTTVVTVREGEGEVTGGGSEFHMDSGDSSTVSGTDTLTYDGGYAGRPDDFDQWCRSRDDREERAQSARYVSRDVIGYEDLDENGDWRNIPEYGNVWFPNHVAAGWAPYRFGRWAWIEPWGWTWVEDEPWGFAPFHYGRWAVYGGGWCWVPGPVVVRPVYAPALVAFVGGPRFGLSISFGGGGGVAWFPLGPREVYVPTYRSSVRYVQNVNVTNTTVNVVNVTNVYNNVNVNNVTYMHQTNIGAVTAVSHDTFVNARPVAVSAMRISPQQLQNAEIQRGVAVAPVRQSIIGSGAAAAVRPPDAVINRQVVVKQTPAPSPVSFQIRQQVLSAQPGRVATSQQMDQLRKQQMQQQQVGKNVPPAQMNSGRQPQGGTPPPQQQMDQSRNQQIQQQTNQSRGQQTQQQPAGNVAPPPQMNGGRQQQSGTPQQQQQQMDQSRNQQMQQQSGRGQQGQPQQSGKFTPPTSSNGNNSQSGRGASQMQAPPAQQQPTVKFAPPAAVNQDTYHPHQFEKPQSAAPAPPKPQSEQQKPPERGQDRGQQRGQDSGKPSGGEQERKQSR